MSVPTADSSSSSRAEPVSAAALRTPTRPAAEFKGLSHPALRLVLNEPDAAAIDTALETLLGDGEAFEWQPVILDAGRVSAAEALPLEAIVERLRAAKLHPVGVAGAHPELREPALALRLGWLAALPGQRAKAGGSGADSTHDDAVQGSEGGDPQTAPHTAASAPTAPGEAAPAPPAGAMVIERPVRSGQQVYARERDLVVIGDVSPGAEVIADGHVHVYGTLGGRAIAGARGRRDAVIFTLALRAELVAVCGIYRTFEDGPPAAHAGKPVRISLEADADTLSMRAL